MADWIVRPKENPARRGVTPEARLKPPLSKKDARERRKRAQRLAIAVRVATKRADKRDERAALGGTRDLAPRLVKKRTGEPDAHGNERRR